MTPDEFASARKRLGLTQDALATLLGYRGSGGSRRTVISRFETGARDIPVQVQIIVGQLLEVKRVQPMMPGAWDKKVFFQRGDI